MKLIALDFEYRKSYNSVMQLICVAWQFIDTETLVSTPVESLWLHDSPQNQEKLKDLLLTHQKTHTILCFNASAEARSVLSLGLNPRDFQWCDAHLEWKIATNNNLDFMYGKISKSHGKYVTSVPLMTKGENLSHEKIGTGLSAMVLKCLDVDLNSEHKTRMRDLILNQTSWTGEEKEEILRYCRSDVPNIFPCLLKFPHYTFSFFWNDAHWRGRWGVNLALCENNGIPIDLDGIFSFAASYDEVKEEIIGECNSVYPFFLPKKIKKKIEYIQSYTQLVQFIKEKSLLSVWPRTETHRFKADEETLDSFRGYKEIEALRKCLQILRQAKWYRPDAISDFLSRVGEDERLRPYLNGLGTATGRNAPPSKQFILAQSKWARALITPPPGMAISGIDYSSQEVAIAAALSGDKALKEAYESGDPYLTFAKQAGAVPRDATRKTHETQRDLFKSTVLACQYGMGARSLSLQIAANTGKSPDEEQAFELLQMHREVYWRYYDWLDEVELDYRAEGFMRLFDGHLLWLSNDVEKSLLSVRNHPIQGTGATVMRYAIDFGFEAGLRILCPLHDAIYHEHPIEETETANAVLKECMDKAVDFVLQGKIKIRNDVKTICHNERWVEKNAEKDWEIMRKFLTNDEGVFLRMKLFDERK